MRGSVVPCAMHYAEPTPAPSPNAPSAPPSDAGFLASRRIVKQTGTYPRERAIAVAGLAGAIGGALFLVIVITGVLATLVSTAAAGVVFLVAVIALAFVGMPYVERRFFAMRCAFAFLATEVLMGRGANVPTSNTSSAATAFLEQHYGDLKAIYETHRGVQNLVRSFFRTFDRLDSILPIDLKPVRDAVNWIVQRVSPRVADLAISHAFARGQRDFAEAGKDTVALIAQNPKPLLGMAVRAHLTERVLGGVIGGLTFVVSFASVFFLAGAIATSAASGTDVPTEGAQALGAFTAVFAAFFVGAPIAWLVSWFVRTAWLEPVTLTMILVRFNAVTHGQAVDPAMRARLDAAGGDLRKANRMLGMFD